jgi:hypothetical protein
VKRAQKEKIRFKKLQREEVIERKRKLAEGRRLKVLNDIAFQSFLLCNLKDSRKNL